MSDLHYYELPKELQEKVKILLMRFISKDEGLSEILPNNFEYHENLLLRKDLGFNSLDAIAFLMHIEGTFEICLPDEEIHDDMSIKDIHGIIAKVMRVNTKGLPTFTPLSYIGTPEQKRKIETGRYLVVRKDGKKHLETFNGSGWAYNNDSIVAYYTPKID
jgi:acyl carrier protein